MQCPMGSSWIEYMLNISPQLWPSQTHSCDESLPPFGRPQIIQAAFTSSSKNGWNPSDTQIGRDENWQLNLYDPDDPALPIHGIHRDRKTRAAPIHRPASPSATNQPSRPGLNFSQLNQIPHPPDDWPSPQLCLPSARQRYPAS